MHQVHLNLEKDGECDCEFITIQSPTHILTLTILDGSCIDKAGRLADTKVAIELLQAQVNEWESECSCCGLVDGAHKFSCSVTKDQRGLTIPVTLKERN